MEKKQDEIQWRREKALLVKAAAHVIATQGAVPKVAVAATPAKEEEEEEEEEPQDGPPSTETPRDEAGNYGEDPVYAAAADEGSSYYDAGGDSYDAGGGHSYESAADGGDGGYSYDAGGGPSYESGGGHSYE